MRLQYILTRCSARWDVFNIKTILRGKHMHLAAEQISEGLLAAGYLTQVDLEALAMQDDIRAVVDTAVTWGLPFAGALCARAMRQYMRSGELADLELALDRYYADWAVETARASAGRTCSLRASCSACRSTS